MKKLRSEGSQELAPRLTLCLHRVLDDVSEHPFTWDMAVSTAQLRSIIRLLKSLGYEFAFLDELDAMHHDGKVAFLTFDDGYIDQFDVLGPILSDEGVKATVFVTPGLAESPKCVWWYVLERWIMSAARSGLKKRVSLDCACGKKHSVTGFAEGNRLYRCLEKKAVSFSQADLQQWLTKIKDALEISDDSKDLAAIHASIVTTDQIRRALQKFPIRIANHGWTHTPFHKLSEQELLDEIQRCHRTLTPLQKDWPARVLAIPYGARNLFTDAQILKIEALGFGPVFSTENENLARETSGAVGRVVLDRSDNPLVWRAKFRGLSL